MGAREMNPYRVAGWLLAITLVLPSLVGWLPMPMRAQAATVSDSGVQTATARLLADLAVLCTPYGLRLGGQDKSGQPAGKLAHDSCVLCGLAATASMGVLQGAAQLVPPTGATLSLPHFAPKVTARSTDDPRPPSRGPPN